MSHLNKKEEFNKQMTTKTILFNHRINNDGFWNQSDWNDLEFSETQRLTIASRNKKKCTSGRLIAI